LDSLSQDRKGSVEQFNIRDFLDEALKSANDMMSSKSLSCRLLVSEDTPKEACGDMQSLIAMLSSLVKLAAT